MGPLVDDRGTRCRAWTHEQPTRHAHHESSKKIASDPDSTCRHTHTHTHLAAVLVRTTTTGRRWLRSADWVAGRRTRERKDRGARGDENDEMDAE
jgi:hypothetical protein